jgi:hypothetical protein
MADPDSMGKCELCGKEFSWKEMRKHLGSCVEEHDLVAKNHKGKAGYVEPIYRIFVGSVSAPEFYWLYIEAPASAELLDVDDFLRSIWLECCGHLSAFTIGQRQFTGSPDGELESDEAGMDVPLGDVLRKGTKIRHEYDFGSTTELEMNVVAEREGEWRGDPIRLLARNIAPAINCGECGKPATFVCAECVYSDGGWLCAKCGKKHECGEDMLLPVANSPRTGVCGYCGPEEA